MDLSIVIVPEHEDVVVENASLASPMSKHQRQHSLSAKWASNKGLALEYLKRQREVILWIEHILGGKLPSTDLHESLKSGVVLRELLAKLFPDTAAQCLSPISRNYSTLLAPWKERENISVFLKQCKTLGMNDLSLFCTDDLYDGNNMVQVMFCVQDFMRLSHDHAAPMLHASVFDDHVMFSNQEVEMALSKIEKAGVDASKLKELMAGSTGSAAPSSDSTTAKRRCVSDNSDDTDADSLLALSDVDHGNDDDDDDDDGKALEDLEVELETLAVGDGCSADSDAADSDVDDLQSELDDDDVECALDDEVDDVECALDEDDVDDDDVFDDDVFDDDDEEIGSLLSDLVRAVEHQHATAATEDDDKAVDDGAGRASTVSEANDNDGHTADAVRDDTLERTDSVQLALDLEDAQRMELPRSRAASEAVETEALVGRTTDHCIESNARTELIDVVGKSATTVLSSATPRSDSHTRSGDTKDTADASGAKTSTKQTKKKSKTKRKKSRELSDEQLDVDAMSRCSCGTKCAIM